MSPSERPRDPLRALHARLRDASEPFHASGRPLGFDLQSFWRWSDSDLMDNTARGVLAEFLVARALDLDLPVPRASWTPYDLVLANNSTVEVKCSAYLQAWGQRSLTSPQFDIACKRAWNHEAGRFEGRARRWSDLYVFALHAHIDKPTADPLNVRQWKFLPVATRELDARFADRKKASLAALSKGRAWVAWDELAAAVGDVVSEMGGHGPAPKASRVRPPRFERYVGIDYSGAQTPEASLPGLQVYEARREEGPHRVPPPPGPKLHWTRAAVAQWLVEQITSASGPLLIGIDHGFSFPIQYFERHRLAHDWPAFLADFVGHWPTGKAHMYVDFVRDGLHGDGAARKGDSRWRRLTEVRAGAAKSVFHFDAPGSVAKSTHAGLPWLAYLRESCGQRVHFWPFDGWHPPAGKSVIAEVYPRLWSSLRPNGDLSEHQRDAWVVAEALRRADRDGSLDELLAPALTEAERERSSFEGWILGVK